MYTTTQYQVSSNFKTQLICWLETQDEGFCFLGSGWNHGNELLAASGVHESTSDFDKARNLIESKNWVFCHIDYDSKNRLEKLNSSNPDLIAFPEASFIVPKFIFKLNGETLDILSESRDAGDRVFHEIQVCRVHDNPELGEPSKRISHEKYLSDVTALQNHMKLGDIYQANYCQEFYWTEVDISGASLFSKGYESMPNPFSVYLKTGDHQCLSFSPERFLQISGNKVISQPMKGTAARSDDPITDEANLDELRNSEKDRRENVMIVDLVRNDLSHFAEKGSVHVPDLYRVETYPKVHQMYSTVEAKIREGVNPLDIVLKAFPMGSMTGAPKIRAMQLLEDYEHSKRGLFSGTIGYFSPDECADFNVIIRTFLFNRKEGVLSCHAGGGITALSDPQLEYDECFVKAQPLFDLVN